MLDRVRISAAVEAALLLVSDAEDRRIRLREYLVQLKTDPKWSDDDIIVVQSRVLRSLAQKAWA